MTFGHNVKVVYMSCTAYAICYVNENRLGMTIRIVGRYLELAILNGN